MKKKLFVSVMSLVMAIILMTSTSFAWFTVSTKGEVKAVEMTMTATKNLEIAKATDGTTEPAEVSVNDGEDETKWGSAVSSFSGGSVSFPAAYSSGFKTVGYTTDGRTNDLEAVTWSTPTLSGGVGTLKHTPTNGKGEETVAAVYGVWLRANEDCTVTATADMESATCDATAFATGKTAADVPGVVFYDGTNFLESGGTISLTANTAKLVYICVYANGDAVIAETVASDITISGISISFEKATT